MCIDTGVTEEQSLKVAEFLEFPKPVLAKAAEQIRRLYELLIKVDATQVEINPFAETSGDQGNILYISLILIE